MEPAQNVDVPWPRFVQWLPRGRSGGTLEAIIQGGNGRLPCDCNRPHDLILTIEHAHLHYDWDAYVDGHYDCTTGHVCGKSRDREIARMLCEVAARARWSPSSFYGATSDQLDGMSAA